ncbi:hypothetical protein ACNKHM_22305 [Shigella sonnei]
MLKKPGKIRTFVHRCPTSGGDIDMTDGTVLRLTQQDTNRHWMPRCLAATVRGDCHDGVTLAGELIGTLKLTA